MKIEWIAHSCFKVTLESGKVMVFDPFGYIGYECPEMEADYVFVSHDHYDHNNVAVIKGEYKLFNAPCRDVDADGITVTGVELNHGGDRGKVVAFKVKAEGLTLLHLGDVGEMPDDDFFKLAEGTDILFIPVGGIYTVDPLEAFEIAKRIEPNVIIPMHYKTLFLNIELKSVYTFTDAAKKYYDRSHLGGNTYELTADNKKKRTRILVMENALDN